MPRSMTPRGWRKVAIASWPKPHDPTTYGVLELDATPALRYLEALRERSGVPVTMLALVLKALAYAMAQEPASTRMLKFGRWVDRESVDLFVQVDRGGRDLSGLKLVDVPAKSLLDVARELNERAGDVRAEESRETLRRSTSVTDRLPMFLMPLALRIQDLLAHDLALPIPSAGIFPDPFGSAMVTNVVAWDSTSPFLPSRRSREAPWSWPSAA